MSTASTVLRRHWASLACLALAAAIGVAAIADHRNKKSRAFKAEVLEWYCAHDGTHCGGPSSVGIEANWNRRQLGYEIAVGSLGGAALLVFFGRALRPADRLSRSTQPPARRAADAPRVGSEARPRRRSSRAR